MEDTLEIHRSAFAPPETSCSNSRLRHNNWTIHRRWTALQGNEAAGRMAEAIENAARRASDLETEMISCHHMFTGII